MHLVCLCKALWIAVVSEMIDMNKLALLNLCGVIVKAIDVSFDGSLVPQAVVMGFMFQSNAVWNAQTYISETKQAFKKHMARVSSFPTHEGKRILRGQIIINWESEGEEGHQRQSRETIRQQKRRSMAPLVLHL